MTFGEIGRDARDADRLEAEFTQLEHRNPLLYRIVLEVDARIRLRWGRDAAVTSIYRPENRQSVHAHWRAVDVGLRSSGLTVPQMKDLAAWVNAFWVYCEPRTHWVAVFGDLDPAGGHWDHMHLQTHAETRPITEV